MCLFETERMQVRKFTTGDAEFFFRVNGDPRVMQFIRPAKNRPDSDAFLQENLRFYQQGSILGRYAVTEKTSGSFLGTFSFLYLDGDADFHIGYALLPEAWGRGYATELVINGAAYFFAHTTHPRLFAITVSANTASRNVLEKAGFTFRGATRQHGEDLELFYLDR